jgi:hypothetical protein
VLVAASSRREAGGEKLALTFGEVPEQLWLADRVKPE